MLRPLRALAAAASSSFRIAHSDRMQRADAEQVLAQQRGEQGEEVEDREAEEARAWRRSWAVYRLGRIARRLMARRPPGEEIAPPSAATAR